MMNRVLDFLKTAEVYYLATVEGDQPIENAFADILKAIGAQV